MKSIQAVAQAATLLADIRAKRFKPVPPSWFTLEQFMEHEGVARNTARKAMEDLAGAGKVDSQRWTTLDTAGRVYQKTIYKLK